MRQNEDAPVLMKAPDTEDLGRLAATLRTGQECFGVWSVLEDPESPLRRYANFNSFAHFFRPTIHAQLAATIIALFSLYDRRKDVVTLCRYEKVFAHLKLSEDYAAAKVLWKKVSVLRHNFFAHQSLKLSMKETFAAAALRPEEVMELIALSRKFVDSLCIENGLSTMVPEKPRSKRDTQRLLEYLLTR